MRTLENYVIAIENKYMFSEELLKLLQGRDVYLHLFERGYIKSGHGNKVAICFVGVISFAEKVICVLPKYFEGTSLSYDEQISQFATLIKVLKKIGVTNEIPDSNNLISNDNKNLSELVLADKFLKDYLEFGIYQKKNSILSLNGNNETNWDISINTINPIFTKRRPIYSDVITSSSITEQYNLVTELHKWIIKYCLQKFGQILDFKFTFFEDCFKEISDLGSPEFIKNSIQKELNDTFSDREILLLKRLFAFLDNVYDSEEGSFSLYGTGYFHVIWEKVCGSVLSNQINYFAGKIPPPMWHDNAGNSVAKDTLKPDIISILGGETSKFFIFDAKYYNLIYKSEDDLTISGNPGVQDVSKQFLYSEVFNSLPYTKKYNCFLFPKISKTFFEVIGSITFTIFKDNKIHNIYLSPNLLFEKYLNNNNKSESILIEIANVLDT